MSRIGERLAAALLTLCCQQCRGEAPISLDALTPIERQQADFYGAIAGDGPGVKIEWKLGPSPVEPGGDTELTLRVHRAANPAELTRPNLAERPEWKAIFGGIGDLPAAIPGEFRYRLKPRAVGEFELPLPKYRYYQPRATEGRRFPVAFAEAPKLAVIAAASTDVPRVPVPIAAPPHFFEDAPFPADTASPSPPAAYWWSLFAASLIGVPCTIAIWRWRHPDAARLARLRREKSTRTALDALRIAGRSSDSPERVSRALLRYFADRWHTPASARTPRELAAALVADGREPTLIAESEAMLGRCDRARFGGAADNGVTLAADAMRLIECWEGIGA